MADFNELISLLRHLLTQKFSPKPNFTKGLLGDGLGNVEVPSKPDHNFVRFNRSVTEFFEIFNRSVTPVHGWPVLIGQLPWQPGLTQVIDTDWEAYEQSGWGDRLGGTGPHAPTHEWPDRAPGSDPLSVHLRSIIPLRAYSLGSGTTTIYVNAYEYDHNATGVVWGGIPGVDLLPVMTATTTGTMRHVGVYLNPATNALAIVTGTTTVHSDALDPPFVDFPGGSIPAARVRVYGGQANIGEIDIEDARRPFAPGVTGSAGGGAPSGNAGGDLTGSYPNPSVAGLFGSSLLSTAPSEGNVLMFTGSAWQPISSQAAGRAWPRPGVSMIGTTEYDTFAAAVAAGVAGDEIRVGAGIFTIDSESVNGVHVAGLMHTSSKLLSIDNSPVLQVTSAHVSKLSLQVAVNSGSNFEALILNNDCVASGLEISATNSGAGDAQGIDVFGQDTEIVDCFVEADGNAVFLDLATGTVGSLYGGNFKSTGDFALRINDGKVKLFGPTFDGVSGSVQTTGSGEWVGWYFDASGDLFGTPRGDLTGTFPNPQVSALFGTPLVDTAPSAGDMLFFTGSAWRPSPATTAGGGAPSGNAGGDLTGTYPNPSVAGLFGSSLLNTVPATGDLLYFTGSAWQPAPIPADLPPRGDAGGDLTGSYPNPSVAGLFGSSLLSTAPSEGDLLMFTGSAWRPLSLPVATDPQTSYGPNLVKNYPSLELADGTQPEWWEEEDGNVTLTEEDASGESIPQKHERVLKIVNGAGGGGKYIFQRYVHADEPLLDEGITKLSKGCWVYTASAGTITLEMFDVGGAASLGTATTTTTGSWVWLEVLNKTIGTTSTDLRIKHSANSATTYVIMPTSNVGPVVMTWRTRGKSLRDVQALSVVNNVDPGGAGFTDVDLTSVTSGLACMAELDVIYRNTTVFPRRVRIRRNGSTRDDSSLNFLSTLDSAEFMVARGLTALDDGQIFEYDTNGAAGETEALFISVSNYWEWES